MPTPEELARQKIDSLLTAAGWVLQDMREFNRNAARGVVVREFPLATGFADYLLFVDGKAAGAVEAKAEGATLSGVEAQSGKYSTGLPPRLQAWRNPLPFLYESTGIETYFTDGRDPHPRSRRTFAFHKPETLAGWLAEPDSLRARLQQLPPLIPGHLWRAQIESITHLEASLADNRPRALIQMATGSGKTFTAVNSVYRLIKHAGAQRVLFLVDRANLGKQTLTEFSQFVTPDDGRKFTELYNVQRLTSNVIDPVSKVCITTIQRLYSMLNNEPDFDPLNEETSTFEVGDVLAKARPKDVNYNPRIPIEMFDFVITDECHRSIYNLWRQVLEYFDAFLIGLTATPSKQTFGFFNGNLVQEYTRQRAVADGVNVDSQIYRIRTEITEGGSTVDAGFYVGKRDRLTRAQRWEQLDEDFTYAANHLDREVVSESQIRTVIRAFRDKLFTDLFPGRTIVPKTIIFAKDDAHAETIVRIVREEFGKGNDFCQKITYRVTGVDPESLIAQFRTGYDPRIAVTVDMISTGTDIKPVEALLFMRAVQSRVLYEQMIGRGTRVIDPNALKAVSSDAVAKTHFVIVDAVGITEDPKVDTQTMERKHTVPFAKLLMAVAQGARDEDVLLSLASRLGRMAKALTPADEYTLAAASGGKSVRELANAILDALEPQPPDTDSPPQAAQDVLEAACAPFDNPVLRNALTTIQQRNEQTIDEVSVDRVRQASFVESETAQRTVTSFRDFIEQNKDEITALQLIYSRPYSQRHITFQQIKELAERLKLANGAWTTEALWVAYAQVERDRVRGVGAQRTLTDLVSLVRHAVQLDDELMPYPERVKMRYAAWMADQEAAGRAFTPEQRWWLDQIVRHIGVNLSIAPNDLMAGEFMQKGGLYGLQRAFADVSQLLAEMNAALVV